MRLYGPWGITKFNWREASTLGLEACILVLVIRFYDIPRVIGSLSIIGFTNLLILVTYYVFVVSLTEEVIFRAFIPSRLSGLFPNKWIRSLFVGFICSLLHVPNYGVQSVSMSNIVGMIIMHFFLMNLYSKYNSIIAPTMVHALWNLMNHLVEFGL